MADKGQVNMDEGVEKGKELKKTTFDLQVAKTQLKYDELSGAPKDLAGRLSYYMRMKSSKQKIQNVKQKISRILKGGK